MSRRQPQDAGPFSMGSGLFAWKGLSGAWPGAFGSASGHALDPTHLWDSDPPIRSSMLWCRCAANTFGTAHAPLAIVKHPCRRGSVQVCALSTTRLPRTREDCVVCAKNAVEAADLSEHQAGARDMRTPASRRPPCASVRSANHLTGIKRCFSYYLSVLSLLSDRNTKNIEAAQ